MKKSFSVRSRAEKPTTLAKYICSRLTNRWLRFANWELHLISSLKSVPYSCARRCLIKLPCTHICSIFTDSPSSQRLREVCFSSIWISTKAIVWIRRSQTWNISTRKSYQKCEMTFSNQTHVQLFSNKTTVDHLMLLSPHSQSQSSNHFYWLATKTGKWAFMRSKKWDSSTRVRMKMKSTVLSSASLFKSQEMILRRCVICGNAHS